MAETPRQLLRRLWLVRLDPEALRPAVLNREAKPVGQEASLRSAQVVEAENERQAVDAWRGSVWDFSVGATLLATPLSDETHRFHREYAHKGAALEGDWPHTLVTVERP